MKRFIWIVPFLFVIATGASAGDAGVSATVDKTRLVSGESLTLTVTIVDGKGDVNIAGIRDFQVSSRGTSSSYNIVNGKMSRKTAYTFTLFPVKKGRLLIPPLPVTVGRKTLYTDLISIEVSDSQGPGADNESADVYAELSVSNTEPYQGEQITCRLSLYHAVQIASPKVVQLPDFPGFSFEQLSDSQAGSKIISGRRYNVAELVYVLTPESTGTHSIGPAAISCGVVKQGARRGRSPFGSFFDDPFFGGGHSLVQRRLNAKPVEVTVRPLPDYTGTDSFSGLVGEFAIATEIDQTEIVAGDSCNMAVIISGRGNIKSATAPGFDMPDAFKVYEDAPVEDIAVSQAGVSGKKQFPAALVALTPGHYTLGPFSLTYFDVDRKDFITIATAPVDITVKQSDKNPAADTFGGHATDSNGLPLPVRKHAVEFTGKDIFPVKSDLSAALHRGTIQPAVFAVLIGWPFLVYFLAGLVVTRLGRKIDDSTIMARRARSAVKAAQDEKPSNEDRLDLLFKAIVYAVYARAGRRGESLTYREARQLLEDRGCEPELVDTACRLLEEIEQARYGGQDVEPDFFNKTLQSVRSVIRRMVS